ncbi:hypothetical protein MAPG_02293 [Magnaporthiopsis poae ATCC 64411]|uniref:Uncharacterized protein n=1 Tax=Magnaporthiopsis poae (strain ATCC 64411 / 73-15) TaxID=644358 RepID=A0A0C4DQZ4_MAGP6|nr:hypothetical protein MAPG_02293 [Magnaporthiopsis poae ATCC 64411]
MPNVHAVASPYMRKSQAAAMFLGDESHENQWEPMDEIARRQSPKGWISGVWNAYRTSAFRNLRQPGIDDLKIAFFLSHTALIQEKSPMSHMAICSRPWGGGPPLGIVADTMQDFRPGAGSGHQAASIHRPLSTARSVAAVFVVPVNTV